MLNFLPASGMFAIAGLVAAAGPVIIHLLNRRRFRVVNWAAMDFLLEALQRNRRMLQLRDLLLLALRTACVLLFGLALARPYFSNSGSTTESGQPLHAILIVDNSLSMGRERLSSNLLDEAKTKAKEFVGDLPEGSRVSVIPLCGSAVGFSRDAYRTKEDARDAIDKIEVVDRVGRAVQAADLALEASRQESDMPAKRIVFLGDQQVIDWPAQAGEQLKQLPEMQVVAITPEEHDNTWVESFTLQDGIADIETPAVFTAVIKHEGPPRSNVQVTLNVDGADVSTSTVDLEPDQAREVTFEHRFDVPAEPGKPVFVAAKVSIPSGDHLPADDSRYLSAPVVAALPVVFVDQYGADEDPKRNRYGETRQLRRLLAPVTTHGDAARQLVQIRHVKIDQLTQDGEGRRLLEDARLVVVAGVANPGESVPLLREYVQQGGQLVIAAGAEFDPSSWNQTAWAGGAGILPLPLKAETVGKLPEETEGEVKPFFLAFGSMAHDYFHLADTPEEELRDLYSLPLFFKAVQADDSANVISDLETADVKRLSEQQEKLVSADAQLKQFAELEGKGNLPADKRAVRDQVEQERTSLQPHWLLWAQNQTAEVPQETPAAMAAADKPRVLAAFENKLPFLIERKVGNGEVLLVTTGLFSAWNTLPKTNTMLLFDRVLRSMLERTLPSRNISTTNRVTLPVVDRNALYTLEQPGGVKELLTVDALDAENYGVTLQNPTQRGIYRVTAVRGDESAEREGLESKILDVPIAVNGPSIESQPAVLDEAGFKDRVAAANFRWIAPGQPISLEGAEVRGQDMWKWLIFLVLAFLVAELLVLARPMVVRERAT